MTKSIKFMSCSVLLLCSISLTGCSVIGYNIGKFADPDRPAESLKVPEALSSLPAKTNVVIQKKDGSRVEGMFERIDKVADTITVEQYRNDFEEWRLEIEPQSSAQMPPFGSSVQIRVSVASRHEIYAGRFAGFDSGTIRVQSFAQKRVLPLRLEYVERMDDSLGRIIATREDIVGVVNTGVPFASRVVFRTGIILEGQPGIAFNNIETIEHPSNGKWVGLTIGIAVDVAVVTLVVSKSNIEAGPGGVEWKWGK